MKLENFNETFDKNYEEYICNSFFGNWNQSKYEKIPEIKKRSDKKNGNENY